MVPWQRLAQRLLPEPHWVPRGSCLPRLGPVHCSSLPPSSLLLESLTVQVAAWDGGLSTLALSGCQEQQAEEQGLGARHGHLKHRG